MAGQLINFERDFADLMTTHNGERFRSNKKSAEGRVVAGVPSPFTFSGTYPQPARANDFRMIPEGSTLSSSIVIHSVDKLNTSESGVAGDVVVWEGDRYRVTQQNRRNHLGGNYRTLLVKIQAGEE